MFVLGAVHHYHAQFEGYTYWHVLKLMTAYSPDLVCIEVGPAELSRGDFRRHSPEKWGIALAWSRDHGVPVAGVDVDADPARAGEKTRAMDELMSCEHRRRQLEDLELALDTMVEEAGGLEALVGTYEAANSKSTQNLWRKIHDLSTSVLGEGPLNGYSSTRNGIIADRVVDAVRDHGSNRALVVIGGEHKHALDDLLARRGLSVQQLADFLPGSLTLAGCELEAFRRGEDPIVYPSDLMLIHRRLHGGEPGSFMLTLPTDPGRLDLTGVREKIDARLARKRGDPDLIYYRGMYRYAVGDYEGAARDFDLASRDPSTGARIFPLAQLALLRRGQMLDLLGDRRRALDSYRKVLGGQVDDEVRPLLEAPFIILTDHRD